MTEPQGNHAKSDTSQEARRVLYDLYRRMPLGRRLELAFDMCDTGRLLAIAGLRMQPFWKSADARPPGERWSRAGAPVAPAIG